MTSFTPVSAGLGGVLIGAAASLLYLVSGRTAGVSGIADGAIFGATGGRAWRGLFLLGLFSGGLMLRLVAPARLAAPPVGTGILVIAGLLVGWGTRVGGGCTSGHGVCGLGRRSPRSLVAVLVFMVTAALVVAVSRGLRGGLI